MFYFKDVADPVGKPHEIESVSRAVEDLKKAWDGRGSKGSFWRGGASIAKATSFMLYSLDVLVGVVNEAIIPGPDKKATVLAALDRLYDYTVREALPIWMRPLASPIKAYVIHVLVSNAIDWVVMKYRSGSWSKKQEPKTLRRGSRRAK